MENLRAALIGRYVVERELGRGGMATVFLARDVQHDRHVAIKVLHPALAVTLGQERFQREIKLAAGLQHPTSSASTTPAKRTASSGLRCPLSRGRAFVTA